MTRQPFSVLGFSGRFNERATDQLLFLHSKTMQPAPVALVIDDGDAANADGQSLQERFEVMRQRRVAAAQRVKAAEAAKKSAPRSDSFKKALRERFVAQARTYVGTPYSAKRNSAMESGRAAVDVQISDGTGQAEVDVQWDAQLYLDCCGLVRRTAHDLKEELGFELGCWNQSYQFDTLPTAIEDAADLKPGDLIFWTGTYNSPNKKAHKHDLVHVEIFTGTGPSGEGTLGSRYEGEGVEQPGVAEFESWRTFGGHGAHGHAVLFRSIDSWLEGVCINHCKSCSWGELNCKRGSSLFCPEASENSDPQ